MKIYSTYGLDELKESTSYSRLLEKHKNENKFSSHTLVTASYEETPGKWPESKQLWQAAPKVYLQIIMSVLAFYG